MSEVKPRQQRIDGYGSPLEDLAIRFHPRTYSRGPICLEWYMLAKKIQVSVVHDLKERFIYCPLTGIISYRSTSRGPRKMRIAGHEASWRGYKSEYCVIKIGKHTLMAHRAAWMMYTGSALGREEQIDHINGVRSDNRITNLRVVSQTLNAQNRRVATKGSASRLLGVYWIRHSRKWGACIGVDGRSHHLGCFRTEEEAHQAYLEAKRRLHPGCTI